MGSNISPAELRYPVPMRALLVVLVLLLAPPLRAASAPTLSDLDAALREAAALTIPGLAPGERQTKRRALLQQVTPDESILFGPAKPRRTIIVFTDVDCPYCRKLHGELDRLQAQGIAVRYMAFPRSGPNTKAWRTMASTWGRTRPRQAEGQGELHPDPASTSGRARSRATRGGAARGEKTLARARAGEDLEREFPGPGGGGEH